MKLKLTFDTTEEAKAAYKLLTPQFTVTYGSSMQELIIPPADRREIFEIINSNDLHYTTS